METMLAVSLTVLIFYLCIKFSSNLSIRRIYGLGVLQAIAILVRPELLILSLSTLLYIRFNTADRFFPIMGRMVFAMLLTLLPWVLFSLFYFHSILPTTYFAKTSGVYWLNWNVLRSSLVVVASSDLVVILLCLICLALVLRKVNLPRRLAILHRLVPFLLFPLFQFLFYYLKTPGLMNAARYYLPALVIIPVVTAIILDEAILFLRVNVLRWLIALVCVSQIAITVFFAQNRIIPVLSRFQDTYLRTMSNAAFYMQHHCQPNDVVLVEFDIGVISYFANSAFRIADGGTLASPELRGLSLQDKISLVKPRYLIQSYGTRPDDLAGQDVRLRFVYSDSFQNHSFEKPELQYYCNIYEVVP
jgi:hypothetical protein